MLRRRTLLTAALLAPTGRAFAADTLKLAVGQKGNWDTSVAELGQRAGIFGKHGLQLDILYTQGSGETLQAVLSRSAEIGVAGGTLGAIGAFARGAPLRILGSEATGAGDLFWYVHARIRRSNQFGMPTAKRWRSPPRDHRPTASCLVSWTPSALNRNWSRPAAFPALTRR